MILSATRSATTKWLLSMSLASVLVLYYSESYLQQVTMPCLLLIIGASTLGFALVVIAARATMIAWITVLVMLTFAGNRRRVLVRRGSLITSDVTVYLFRVVVKERGLLALACAALLSLTAMVRCALRSN